jgi:hypothetical protein
MLRGDESFMPAPSGCHLTGRIVAPGSNCAQ